MMKTNCIGYVVSVNGNHIDVILDNKMSSDMLVYEDAIIKIGQIGGLVKIPIGYVSLIGIITSIKLNEKVKDDEKHNYSNYRHVDVILLGEISGKRFEKGVTQFPLTKDNVYLLTNEELEIIHLMDRSVYPLKIGQLCSNESIEIMLDMNKLITRHSIIIGATGMGKSNATTVILKEISKDENLKSSRIFVIDPHGEYSKTLKDKSKIFKINPFKSNEYENLYVPYWALDINSLLELFYNNLNELQLSYLTELILDCKVKASIKRQDTDVQLTIDTPYPYNLQKLWYELDRKERRTIKERANNTEDLIIEGNWKDLTSAKFNPPGFGSSPPFIDTASRKGIQSFLDSVRAKLIDSRFDFLFHPNDYTPDEDGLTQKDLDDLLFEWFGHDRKITIMDLSNIPSHIHHILVGTIMNIVYNSLTMIDSPVNGKDYPMLFVLEEAHTYFSSNNSSMNVAKNVIERISKEGRKYGAGLMMITQRPSEIGDTIISQMGTIMCLRLNNPKDKSYVVGAIDSDMDSITNTISTLRIGEAILIGEAVKVPCKVKYYLENEGFSSDPLVSKEWKKDKPTKDLYSKMLKVSRNKKEVKVNE